MDINDYKNSDGFVLWNKFCEALKEENVELQKEYDRLYMDYHILERLKNMYRRGIDKLSTELDIEAGCPKDLLGYETSGCKNCDNDSRQCWKEWCLENE